MTHTTRFFLALALGLLGVSPCAIAQPPSGSAPPLHVLLGPRQAHGFAASASSSRVAPHVAAGGRVSIVRAVGRIGDALEPHPEDADGAMALLHGPDGALVGLRPVEVDGRALRASRSAPAPDGGAVVIGNVGSHDGAPVALTRIGPDGAPRWVVRAQLEPEAGCNPRQRQCGFVAVEDVVAHGDQAFAIVGFLRGTLRFDGGSTIAGRGSMNRVLIAIDLPTGALRATPITGTGDPGLVLLSQPGAGDAVAFVSAAPEGPRARATLAVYDAATLRPRGTIRLARPGVPRLIVAHDGGIAAYLATPDARRWVASFDARGRERFAVEVPDGTVLAGGSTLFLGRPAGVESRQYPTGSWSGELVASSLTVEELDGRGTPVRAWTHAGYFSLPSLALHAGLGGPWLSGTRLDGPSATLFAHPVGTVLAPTAPPGEVIPPRTGTVASEPFAPGGGTF